MSNIGAPGGFHNAHDVEADALEDAAAKREVLLGRPADPRLFDGRHRFDRRATRERAPDLHLDEDEDAAIERDEVDLAAAAAEVAFEDMVAAGDEEIGGRALAAAADRSGGSAAPAFHGSAPAVAKSNDGWTTGVNDRRCAAHGPSALSAAMWSAVE